MFLWKKRKMRKRILIRDFYWNIVGLLGNVSHKESSKKKREKRWKFPSKEKFQKKLYKKCFI